MDSSITHDARGNVTQFDLGNGVETTRAYDALTGRLSGILSTKGVTTIQNLDYTLDVIGNLTRREDLRVNQNETFNYDTLNRVIQVDTTHSTSRVRDVDSHSADLRNTADQARQHHDRHRRL